MANEWTLNSPSTPVKKGMLVRRLGLDEALEVLAIRNEQMKIKLPDGKTSTIPASAEVEWSWPETSAKSKPMPVATEPEREPAADNGRDSEWLTDWSLLDPGIKIAVLGEPGDFTILRLTDSNARIKHNTTGQIQSLSIGHKFKVLDSDKRAGKIEDNKSAKPAKAKADKKSTLKPAALPFNEPDTQLDEIPIDGDEPSDEVLAAIENGDDEDETEDTADTKLDPDSLKDLDDDDTEDDINNNEINDSDDTEDDPMPKPIPAAATRKLSRSTSLLTVGAISERTGISYPTLMRYIRDHGDRLPSEGEGRARRFLPEAIDVFRQIRSETKGGRPRARGATGASAKGSGSASPRANRKPRSDKGTSRVDRPERSHETAAPYAAPAKIRARASAASQPVSSSSTIDQALASAIDHARGQMEGLQLLIENLEAQRESLKLWS